jgi:hypothetical protein
MGREEGQVGKAKRGEAPSGEGSSRGTVGRRRKRNF